MLPPWSDSSQSFFTLGSESPAWGQQPGSGNHQQSWTTVTPSQLPTLPEGHMYIGSTNPPPIRPGGRLVGEVQMGTAQGTLSSQEQRVVQLDTVQGVFLSQARLQLAHVRRATPSKPNGVCVSAAGGTDSENFPEYYHMGGQAKSAPGVHVCATHNLDPP